MDMPEPAALGAEFVRWEIATSVAGALLGVNPFDEPNVQQAKDATRVLLDRHKSDGVLPASTADETTDGIALTLSAAARAQEQDAGRLLRLVDPGDYVGVLAYLPPDAAFDAAVRRFRTEVRRLTSAATMFGYGPRYLHSTGQLHKGGANTGVFVLITASPANDLDIPGQPYTFGTLEMAQALGDFASLEATGRRAVHVHLPAPEPAHLSAALDLLLERFVSA